MEDWNQQHYQKKNQETELKSIGKRSSPKKVIFSIKFELVEEKVSKEGLV